MELYQLRNRRYCWKLRAIANVAAPRYPSSANIVTSNDVRTITYVAAPNADVSASSADSVASNDECFMFHIVLRVFHDVLLVVHYFLRCITMFYVFHNVLLCLTMFSESHNERRRRISNRAAADRLRDLDNATGIGDNSAGIIAMAPQGSSILPRT